MFLSISQHFIVLFSVTFIPTEATVFVYNPFYCYATDPHRPQTSMFSTHTSYESVRGHSINATVSTFSPSKFWMLGKYTTRAPDSMEMQTDFELLRNWKLDPKFDFDNVQNLTAAGWNELVGIAKRYQAAFPSLLTSNYSPNDYFFRSTGERRAVGSLQAFTEGLFGTGAFEAVEFAEVPDRDYLLVPFNYCPLHQNVTAASRAEQDAFRDGPEYQEMISLVSAKLGFQGSRALRTTEIDVLFWFCQYEQIWNSEEMSPYCAAFSIANHQMYEYYRDVGAYYVFGFGQRNYRRLLENVNCFLIRDLLTFIQSDDASDHKARIYNTLNRTLAMFLLHFGVFEDDPPLTRHNFSQQANRVWKSSLINPMTVNIAIVKYQCAGGDNDVLLLHNEIPLQIAGCQPNGLCKESFLMERLDGFLNKDCMETFCSN